LIVGQERARVKRRQPRANASKIASGQKSR
jgi:hypothetical protein